MSRCSSPRRAWADPPSRHDYGGRYAACRHRLRKEDSGLHVQLGYSTVRARFAQESDRGSEEGLVRPLGLGELVRTPDSKAIRAVYTGKLGTSHENPIFAISR